jgi:SAM-dependent methyltransferase
MARHQGGRRPMSAASDTANAEFWNELCGTTLAKSLGIADDSAASLARFDCWYFDFYPYLEDHIPFGALAGKRVLEVGLGYGSVAQRLIEAGAAYHGLDIAAGPVAMARHRLKLKGAAGDVRQGSILDCPWPDASFDYLVAIGCYHHTGNLDRAIAESRRVLRSGGGATIMVYNAYSHRRWSHWPLATARALLAEWTGHRPPLASEAERAAYDVDSAGRAAPETIFVSPGRLRRIMRDWSAVRVRRENVDLTGTLGRIPRRWQLPALGPWLGLDLYCRAVK